MKKAFVLLFLSLLFASCKVGKRNERLTNVFFFSSSGKKALCQMPIFDNAYYYVEFDEFNNVKLLERASIYKDTLFFEERKENTSVNFHEFIEDNNFTKVNAKRKVDIASFESYTKLLAPWPSIHQITKDSTLLFKSLFSVTYNTKTIVSDTFYQNYRSVIPDTKTISIQIFQNKQYKFAFITHVWSVEEKYDIYSKYQDYIILLED